jgi:hypothetical protein
MDTSYDSQLTGVPSSATITIVTNHEIGADPEARPLQMMVIGCLCSHPRVLFQYVKQFAENNSKLSTF